SVCGAVLGVRRHPARGRGRDPPGRRGGGVGGGRAPGGLTARLPYPDRPLTDGTVRLRPWERGDVACAAEGKGVDESAAFGWLEAVLQRQVDDSGLALAVADVRSDEALGSISLNPR